MDKILEYLHQDTVINDLYKIIESLIDYYRLEDYVSSINIKSTSSNKYGQKNIIRTASYNFDSQDIYFYIDGIKKKIAYMIRKYLMYSDKDINLYKNIIVFEVILHELEHVNQNRVLHQDNCFSHEKGILQLYSRFNIIYIYDKIMNSGCNNRVRAYELARQIYNDVYKDIYDCDPVERVANIRCIIKIIDILNDTGSKELIFFETRQLNFFYKRGYTYKNDELLSPFNEYIRVTGIDEDYNIPWYDKDESKSLAKVLKKYNYNERVLYGLPLLKDEYKML